MQRGVGIVVRAFPDIDEYDVEFLQDDSHVERVKGSSLRVRHLKESDIRSNENWWYYAAATGDIELLKFALKNGLVRHSLCGMMRAIGNGHWEYVKYMHDNGCEWPKYACKQAIQH
eukprot:5507172-Prymnesium_polylepis.1